MQITKSKNQPKKQEVNKGFLGGLNAFQDETLIKDSELTEAKNIILNVDGISPRPGLLNYGSEDGNNVVGSIAYYQADGTRELRVFNENDLEGLKKEEAVTIVIASTVGAKKKGMIFEKAKALGLKVANFAEKPAKR